jgi:hypothetical protein
MVVSYGTHRRELECIGFWQEKSERKIPLGRPRRRWKNNIKMDLRKVVRPGLI